MSNTQACESQTPKQRIMIGLSITCIFGSALLMFLAAGNLILHAAASYQAVSEAIMPLWSSIPLGVTAFILLHLGFAR